MFKKIKIRAIVVKCKQRELKSRRWFVVVVLFTARGVAAGFFQTVYVYTPEVYPTKLRALAMGISNELKNTQEADHEILLTSVLDFSIVLFPCRQGSLTILPDFQRPK